MNTIPRMCLIASFDELSRLCTEYYPREKARVPAWCDRILWKGANLHQVHYNTANLRFSDHRPVYATFHCVVNAIEEGLKDELRRRLYTEQQRRLHSALANADKLIDTESDETRHSLDSPRASSDSHRWWLDRGIYPRVYLFVSQSSDVINRRASKVWLGATCSNGCSKHPSEAQSFLFGRGG